MAKFITFLTALLVLFLSACNINGIYQTPTPFLPTEIHVTPSATSEPMAVWVNGEGILLSDYQAELQRFQAGQIDPTTVLSPADQQIVLDSIVNELLLAQGAAENGYILDNTGLTQRLNDLIEDAGGEAIFSNWLAENYFTIDSFERALQRAVEAAWMRDRIAEAVPTSVEQIHARQILLLNLELAEQVFAQLESGIPFQDLAEYYDPITSGDLGWFPRGGYLTQPLIEEAAFNLQPGEFSTIIETEFGYHIIQVIDRNINQEIMGDVLAMFQGQAVNEWVINQRALSTIETILQ